MLLLLLLPVEEPYLNNHITNKHKNCLYTFLFLACALSGYIFINPFTSCFYDRYQHKQCIIMETETEINIKICEILLVVCATCCYNYFR